MSMKKLILLIVLLVSLVAAACAPRYQFKEGDSNATKAKKAAGSAVTTIMDFL